MAQGKKITTADAADILGVYATDVASVDDTDQGTVATTSDGHRYLLTGAARGDYDWLREPAETPGT